MMKFFLTGANGQVGSELCRSLAPLGDVVAVGRADCDLGDLATLERRILAEAPDVIVNAAAYTNVDRAEAEERAAFVINADAPATLARAAARCGARMIHYSTDYVFDGSKPLPYHENDQPRPCNAYGRSKHAGEVALSESGVPHLIVRTSWVMGVHGHNFIKTIVRLAGEREVLRVVDDQIGAPTAASMLADVSAAMVKTWQGRDWDPVLGGIYHCTARGATSWYDYARVIVHEMAARFPDWPGARVRIEPISSVAYNSPAMRPANSRLETSKLCDTFGVTLPEWRSRLKSVLSQISV